MPHHIIVDNKVYVSVPAAAALAGISARSYRDALGFRGYQFVTIGKDEWIPIDDLFSFCIAM